MIELTINGRKVALESPMTLRELLNERSIHEEIVVIEHNREIVPRNRFGEVRLQANDQVEIVQMMAGG